MARCLVIGGNGFVGSHVVDELARLGHEVAVFDRFSGSGVAYEADGVERIVGDFLNEADVNRAIAGRDHVLHFLSTTTPASAEDDPKLDVRTNIEASIHLFDAVSARGEASVYFASTGGAIYGDSPTERFDERVLPQPISPYAIGKLAIEGYLRYFARKRGLRSVTFRISNPYGPRQRANKRQGVIPIFLQRIANGLPVTIYGDGSMVRDYLYVGDAARMVARVVGRPAQHELYNIGSGTGVALTELVHIMSEVTGREILVDYLPVPPTFVSRVVLDTERFSSEFGVTADLGLREGILRTWRDTIGEAG